MRFEDYREEFSRIVDRVTHFGDRIGQEAAAMSRRISRLTRSTFQGASHWLDDDQLFRDMKSVLDRAVREMDAAWDAARKRRKDRREQDERERQDGDGDARRSD